MTLVIIWVVLSIAVFLHLRAGTLVRPRPAIDRSVYDQLNAALDRIEELERRLAAQGGATSLS
jgi:hypothetical protein